MNVLPEKIKHFLKSATFGVAGTRNESLEPFAHVTSGWQYDEVSGNLACYFAKVNSVNLLETLESNGDFSVSIVEMPSHETYQLKGKFIGSHACSPEELDHCQKFRNDFTKKSGAKYKVVQNVAEIIFSVPSITVLIHPDFIYDQAPGPEAGKVINMGSE